MVIKECGKEIIRILSPLPKVILCMKGSKKFPWIYCLRHYIRVVSCGMASLNRFLILLPNRSWRSICHKEITFLGKLPPDSDNRTAVKKNWKKRADSSIFRTHQFRSLKLDIFLKLSFFLYPLSYIWKWIFQFQAYIKNVMEVKSPQLFLFSCWKLHNFADTITMCGKRVITFWIKFISSKSNYFNFFCLPFIPTLYSKFQTLNPFK